MLKEIQGSNPLLFEQIIKNVRRTIVYEHHTDPKHTDKVIRYCLRGVHLGMLDVKHCSKVIAEQIDKFKAGNVRYHYVNLEQKCSRYEEHNRKGVCGPFFHEWATEQYVASKYGKRCNCCEIVFGSIFTTSEDLEDVIRP